MSEKTRHFRIVLTKHAPFDLRLALFGHGWIDLDPHHWDPTSHSFHSVLQAGKQTVDLTLRQTPHALQGRLTSRETLTDQAVSKAKAQVQRMLQLNQSSKLAEFWDLCQDTPRLHWVAKQGGGRLLRSAHLFEDLMKLLFTTNCSWAATRKMTTRLVSALGKPAPSGKRGFPAAKDCAAAGAQFFRQEVRAGYRANFCAELAQRFAEGEMQDEDLDDSNLATDTVRKRLLALPGFGPYAAGQALRLLGHYDDLALDSWCRNKLAELAGRRQAPSEATVRRRYQTFGNFRGLALWMDLTAGWHEGEDRLL